MKLFKFTYGVKDTALEKELSNKIFDIKQSADQDIGFAAKQNINPKTILFDVAAKCKTIKGIVTTHFQPEISKLNKLIQDVGLELLKEIGLKQEEVITKEINALDMEIKRTYLDFNWIKRKWARIGIFTSVSLDAIANWKALQVLVENLLISGIVAVLVAFGLYYAVHQIAIKITAAPSRRERIIWYLIGIMGGAVVFFVLGLLRQTFYGNNGSLMASPVVWTLWNLFFYCIALLLAVNNTPSKVQVSAYERLNEKKSEKNKLEKRKLDLLNQIVSTETRVKNWNKKLCLIEKYEEELLSLIDSERNQICTGCIKEYELKGGTVSFTQVINELKKQAV